MNGFIKKSLGTLTLGEKLKKLRSERRVSLGDISRVTRIRVQYLECLEEGKYDDLPADVYTRGFLKSYADFFGLDEKILLRLYEREKGIKNSLAKNGNGEKDKKKVHPISVSFISITPKKITLSVIILLAVSIVFFIYRELGSFASVPKLVILSPEDNSEIEGNLATISGTTEKDARLFINGQPILVNDEGKFLENLTLQSGPNTINVKSINRFNKEAEKILIVNSKAELSEIQNSDNLIDEKTLENNTEEIALELKIEQGPVWLSVEVDGRPVFNGTMLSGASQTFKAQEKIIVDSGKGNATMVKFNGQDIGKLSESGGVVRGIVFDKNTKF